MTCLAAKPAAYYSERGDAMNFRPLVLQGSEQNPQLPSVFDDPAFTFDGKTGLWVDQDGHPAILRCSSPATTKTATREGIDQTEVAGFSTTITKTREGTDQAEVTGMSTVITETREGIDQTEVASWSTHNTRTREGVDQVEVAERNSLD
jgi:hypothetical protein